MDLAAAKHVLSSDGRRTVLRYVAISAVLNLAWEIAQLPLYAIWQIASAGRLAFAVMHCTLGDVLIAACSLFAALLLVGNFGRRSPFFGPVTAVSVLIAVAYALFSEWLNISVRGSWAYASAMPVLPPLGTGLTPLLQWIVIPPLGFALARNRALNL